MENTTTKWVLGHKVTPHDTSGNYDLTYGKTAPGVPGPPPHLHHSLKEVFLVTEGEMEFMVNGTTRVVRAGESVDLPPGTVHTFSNNGDQPCKWVNIHSPKGFRAFFEELGVSVDTPGAREKSVRPEVIQKVIQQAPDYDMHIAM